MQEAKKNIRGQKEELDKNLSDFEAMLEKMSMEDKSLSFT